MLHWHVLYPSREKFSVDRPRGIGLSLVNQITGELSCDVVIDNVGNGGCLLPRARLRAFHPHVSTMLTQKEWPGTM
jgi:hypothetical protein